MAKRTGAPCSIEGCDKPTLARGWCAMHYNRWRTYGEPGEAEPRRFQPRPCAVDGCENLTGRKGGEGYCPTHYRRLSLYGDPLLTKETATRCEVCGKGPTVVRARRDGLCREHYIEWVCAEVVAGRIEPNTERAGYQYISVFKKQYPVHRLVLEHKLGRKLQPGETPHHKNGVRSDNRPENLELWVKPQPNGQRAEDLVRWVVEHYPDLVRKALEA